MESTKIRMIFCDVDGTLLPRGESNIEGHVFDAINKAVSSDIKICIASGRSYPDLNRLFAPVAEKVVFICNDGASVIEKGGIYYSSPLDKSQIACMSRTFTGYYDAMVLYAKDYTYYLSDKVFHNFGKKITSDLIRETPGDIFKVAFYHLSDLAETKIENLGVKPGVLNKVYKDFYWTEYIPSGTDKGSAAEKVQSMYGISPVETAAFGDNLNDLGMLRRARLTYASNKAHHEVVKMCKFKTNDVTKEILNIIEKGDRYE